MRNMIQKLQQHLKSLIQELRFNDRPPLMKISIIALGLFFGLCILWGAARLGGLVMHSACTVIMSDDTKERLRKRAKPVLIEAAKVTPEPFRAKFKPWVNYAPII